MSRLYEMTVTISGYHPANTDKIQAAAEREWPFTDWWDSDDEDLDTPPLEASAQSSLCGGESEEEFTERLSVAIWQANGGYCCVVVNATYLENLPYETHTLGEEDYDRLLQQKEPADARDQRAGDASGG
jgi:hypothetical protein